MTESRGSVLVIDDEPAIRGLLVKALGDQGFHVRTAESGSAGIEAARAQRFDLAVTDLSMPGMDGVRTLEQLKQIDPGLEVIVITGYATVDSAIACLKMGAFDYVEKPFTLKQIQITIERALERNHLHGVVSLYEASAALLSVRDAGELVRRVPDLGTRLLKAETAALVVRRASPPDVRMYRSEGESQASGGLLTWLADWALESDKPLLLTMAETEASPKEAGDAQFGSVVAFPLKGRGAPFGSLVLLRGVHRLPFTTSEAQRGMLLAAQVSLALDNARLYGELEARLQELSSLSNDLALVERQSRAILSNAPDGIVSLDTRGLLIDMNPAAETIFRTSAGEWIGRSFADLLRRDGTARDLPDAFRSTLAGGRDPGSEGHLEITARRASGEEFCLELSFAAVPRPDGITHSVFIRDLTRRKQLEVELRHAQKLESVGMLASGIAHEINTPIQFVGDNTHFLEESFRSLRDLTGRYRAALSRLSLGESVPESELRDIRKAEGEADLEFLQEEIPRALAQALDGLARVATIVRAMKSFAHPDGKEMSPADLNEALRSTLTVARNELKYVTEVETDFGDLPPVTCHAGDLNQVFLNLLVNAAHAISDVVGSTGAKGKVTVRTSIEGDSVVVAIRDTGTGIPEAAQPRIFDPFFTTKEVGKGTGQGLAIARTIVVEKHGGSLTFETSGSGTTFFVRLPVEGAAVAAGVKR
jgi:PAS domain S-box-containing protein